ncbi:reverse transcriptase domain-containing protein [Tanacetum coccineum]
MEKLVLSLVFDAKRLQRYFQAHPIAVITDQPIKQIISRPDVAGRLQKWNVVLGEHNITYRPRTSVKGQILADFLIEKPDENGSGAGLILTSQEGTEFTYALRFQFTASNNEAEYEALIAGLRIAEQMGVPSVHVSVNSKLVANQVLGAYVAKEENMIKYLEKVKSLVLVEILKENSIQEKEVTTVVEEDGPTWMTQIIEYLKEGTLPADKKEASKLRIKARQYELLEETGQDSQVLKAVHLKEGLVVWVLTLRAPDMKAQRLDVGTLRRTGDFKGGSWGSGDVDIGNSQAGSVSILGLWVDRDGLSMEDRQKCYQGEASTQHGFLCSNTREPSLSHIQGQQASKTCYWYCHFSGLKAISRGGDSLGRALGGTIGGGRDEQLAGASPSCYPLQREQSYCNLLWALLLLLRLTFMEVFSKPFEYFMGTIEACGGSVFKLLWGFRKGWRFLLPVLHWWSMGTDTRKGVDKYIKWGTSWDIKNLWEPGKVGQSKTFGGGGTIGKFRGQDELMASENSAGPEPNAKRPIW